MHAEDEHAECSGRLSGALEGEPELDLLFDIQKAWTGLANVERTERAQIERQWRVFEGSSTDNTYNTVTDGQDLADKTVRATASTLITLFTHRDAKLSPSLLNHEMPAVEELAGIFVSYLLPLRPLLHLSRPFRLKPFLHFLRIPYISEVPMLLRRIFKAWFIFNFALPRPWSPAVQPFTRNLQFYLVAAQQTNLLDLALDLLDEALRMVHLEVAIPKLEERLEEEVLEGVVRWKERKNAFEVQQRLKKD